jgi:hypothetical protein
MRAVKRYFRQLAAVLALGMALSGTGCGQQTNTASNVVPASSSAPVNPPAQQGMSTKKKVVLLAGAALLYYLYKKHQASQATATSGAQQLYRSSNGGIYYRDAQHNPVWLTVPQGGIQVPEDQVQQYAPDYQNYPGNAPPVPSGYRAQPFSQYDPTIGTDRR